MGVRFTSKHPDPLYRVEVRSVLVFEQFEGFKHLNILNHDQDKHVLFLANSYSSL